MIFNMLLDIIFYPLFKLLKMYFFLFFLNWKFENTIFQQFNSDQASNLGVVPHGTSQRLSRTILKSYGSVRVKYHKEQPPTLQLNRS